jgi:hypothetical protein
MRNQLDPDRLSRLVDVEGTAAWRWLKAEQDPNDPRNARAAKLLERLAPEIAALNGSPYHVRIETFAECEAASFEISSILKAVGFQFYPVTGEELIKEIIACLERYCTRGRYLRSVQIQNT